MNVTEYKRIRAAVEQAGYGDDIAWAEAVKPPVTAEAFAREFIFVVCNSGMKFTVAVPIFRKIIAALKTHKRSAYVKVYDAVRAAFGHAGKVGAIAHVYSKRKIIFEEFTAAPDKLEFCGALPWIGPITKFHLAKNCGVDCAKPDRHLDRIARHYGITVENLCNDLAQKTGDRIGTVDVVLWRASAIGIINTPELERFAGL